VLSYLNGGQWSLLEEFTEIESGKRSDRTQLAAALAACRLHKATLIIAKLDRLSRNVAFVSSLMEAGVDFEAVDFPQANRLTIHILAAVAEHEAKAISDRTKAALQAAKARGIVLGGFRGRAGTAADMKSARAVRAAAADQRSADLAGIIIALQATGITSLGAMAAALNSRQITAPRGGNWTSVQVKRVYHRISGLRKPAQMQ
jgi:DNA invertase Pin-like site-specific DNA recombinase